MTCFKRILYSHACLSFFFGLMATLAFAPFRIYPIIIVSFAGLLWVFIQSTPKQACRHGFYYGLGLFGAGVYWVYISLHAFGDAPVIFSLLMTLVFVAILALFPAGVGACINRYFPENTMTKLCLAFPAIWTLSEWVRTWIFTGFPWLLAGASQTVWPLKGIAAIAGVYMISFVLAHIAGLLIYFYYAPSCRRKISIYLLCLLSSCGLISLHQWTHPAGTPFQVSLVQGNVTPSLKWQPGYAEQNYQHYLKLSEHHWDHSLVIWPEAAIAIPLPDSENILSQLKHISQQHDAGFISGIPYETADATSDYNAAIAVGNAYGQYFKRHLVPFGEYFPDQLLVKYVLSWLHIPMSNFKTGTYNQQSMVYNKTVLSTFICYEIIFPEEVRLSLNNAGVILLLSDDAWFGHSIAASQHIQLAQMRALETGRYVLSVTNNGITAIINPEGQIVTSLPPYQSGVLTGNITSYDGETPWIKLGSNIYLLICIFSLILSRMLTQRKLEANLNLQRCKK